MKNEEIFYTHKQNAVVDNSGKQIAIVLPSNCTMREARAMAAFAAQQMNHELRAKKLKKSNAQVQTGTTAPQPDPERDEAARRGASPGTKC